MSVITTRPEQVISFHADLASQFGAPDVPLLAYTLNFMTSVAQKAPPGTASSMFYPAVRDDRVTLEAADRVCRIISRDLSEAVTYEVTAEMIAAMRQTSALAEETSQLEQAELPRETGFAWFDEDWPLTDKYGELYHIRAVSWRFTTTLTDGLASNPAFAYPVNWPCVRVCLWVHTADDPPEYRERIRANGMGPMQLVHVTLLPFGMDMTVEPELRQGQGESFLGIVHMLWMFLGMEITATRRAKVQNHYRKHALKSIRHGEVHVVLLRRVRFAGEKPGAQGDVDWTCRWPVQGHWRHLSAPGGHPHRAVALTRDGDKLCAVCDGRLTWVRPYLKGPDGKPLKVSETLMKLAR